MLDGVGPGIGAEPECAEYMPDPSPLDAVRTTSGHVYGCPPFLKDMSTPHRRGPLHRTSGTFVDNLSATATCTGHPQPDLVKDGSSKCATVGVPRPSVQRKPGSAERRRGRDQARPRLPLGSQSPLRGRRGGRLNPNSLESGRSFAGSRCRAERRSSAAPRSLAGTAFPRSESMKRLPASALSAAPPVRHRAAGHCIQAQLHRYAKGRTAGLQSAALANVNPGSTKRSPVSDRLTCRRQTRHAGRKSPCPVRQPLSRCDREEDSRLRKPRGAGSTAPGEGKGAPRASTAIRRRQCCRRS